MTARKGSAKKAARKAAKPRSGSSAARKAPPAAPGEAAARSGKLYYRIGEVAEITGVKPYVLRYWESEFRWMAPQKSRSKQRLYRQQDIDTILLIKKLLYEERYTIAGARKHLRGLGVGERREQAAEARAEAEHAAYDPVAALASIRAELQALRSALSDPA